MKNNPLFKPLWTGAGLSLITALTVHAVNILAPGDYVIAINTNPGGVYNSQGGSAGSSYPSPGETPAMVLDGSTGTKYLNFGQRGSGLIVTPTGGASVVQSMVIATANDAAGRDPTSYQIWGTNSAITSADNSRGISESWTYIGGGALQTGVARLTAMTPVDFINSAAYTSYKVIFPTVANQGSATNSMQFSELQLFTGAGGTGTGVLGIGAAAVGIDNDSRSAYPTGEHPGNLFDGASGTKYLNFGEEGSGFIVRPASGLSIVNSFSITTANDAPERDPSSYEIWGTNSALVSSINGRGDEGEIWTLISSGGLSLPAARLTDSGPVGFANSSAYTAYKVIFPTTNLTTANSMQIAEFQFDGILVPEPSTALLGLAGLGFLARRRRH